MVVGHAPLWETHLSYALDQRLRSGLLVMHRTSDRRQISGRILSSFCFATRSRYAASNADANGAHVMIPTRSRVAEQYVSANVAQAPSVDDVAAAAGISACSLHGLFTKFRGVSPSEFIRDQRLAIRN